MKDSHEFLWLLIMTVTSMGLGTFAYCLINFLRTDIETLKINSIAKFYVSVSSLDCSHPCITLFLCLFICLPISLISLINSPHFPFNLCFASSLSFALIYYGGKSMNETVLKSQLQYWHLGTLLNFSISECGCNAIIIRQVYCHVHGDVQQK